MKIRLVFGILWILATIAAPVPAQNRQEEVEDYYKKWLDQDVVYIISEEERDVFLKLTTDQERDRFIEQFWERRDSDPKTAINEFKEEHFRRIQYANERFASGIPGWKTDRGMIYIKFGPPAQIEARPSGGHYNRPFYEGGGSTSTFPFETWRYRYLEGIGQDIEIEFVDTTLSGEYHIATNPWEKDALLTAPGAGPTLIEQLGLSTRADRINPKTNPMPGHNPIGFGYGRRKDQPFEKLHLLTDLQRAPKLSNPKLREFVDSEVRYDSIEVSVRNDFLRIEEDNYLVAVTLSVPNRQLQYLGKGDVHKTVLEIYGELEDLTGRVIHSFEDEVTNEITTQNLARELQRFSLYQKTLTVKPGRYKLQLAVQDQTSQNIGTVVDLVVVPRIPKDTLASSSIIPALQIEPLESAGYGQFELGPVRVFPNPTAELKIGRDLPLFFQIYNLSVDQASGSPEVNVRYSVTGESGSELYRLSERLEQNDGAVVSVAASLPLADLPQGKYKLEVEITDQIQRKSIVQQLNFSVTG